MYSDDGVTQLGTTTTDNTLYTALGWAVRSLTAPIPAVSTARFVWVLAAVNGYSAAPGAAYAVVGSGGGETLRGGNNKPNHRRTMFGSITSFPSPFVPGSFGTPTNFLPLVALG